MMTVVTVSPKYQVVIPKEVRTALRLKPGQKLSVHAWDGGVSMVPEMSIEEFRMRVKGLENDFVRDRADRDPYPWPLPRE